MDRERYEAFNFMPDDARLVKKNIIAQIAALRAELEKVVANPYRCLHLKGTLGRLQVVVARAEPPVVDSPERETFEHGMGEVFEEAREAFAAKPEFCEMICDGEGHYACDVCQVDFSLEPTDFD